MTPAEIKDLTGVAMSNIGGQIAALELLGIPCRSRGRRVLVSRHHVREWLTGRGVPASRGVRLDLVR